LKAKIIEKASCRLLDIGMYVICSTSESSVSFMEHIQLARQLSPNTNSFAAMASGFVLVVRV
jgi:hypothetical protein